jgi:hypothetical protein
LTEVDETAFLEPIAESVVFASEAWAPEDEIASFVRLDLERLKAAMNLKAVGGEACWGLEV